jgi:ubiquinone/menaquinone biosynthesis C-methylase UbiE
MSDVSPDLIVDAVTGFHRSAALKAGVDLGVFAAIAHGAATADEIAIRAQAAPRGIRSLCDYLAVMGLLEKVHGRYALTKVSSVFLDPASPAYLGAVTGFLAAPELTSLYMADPAAFVRNGGSPGLSIVSADNPVWVTFARAMTGFVAATAAAVAAIVSEWDVPPRRVLDIAAGHGLFGIRLAERVPGAEITALDWANVLLVAQENAAKAGVTARYHTLPGSAFDLAWGGGYDLILLPNFLHHFDTHTNIGLLRKARENLGPGGRVIAIEFVPAPDRSGPPFPVHFSFMMLATTRGGDAYTEAEYEAMACDAGFATIRTTSLPPSPQTLVEFLL